MKFDLKTALEIKDWYKPVLIDAPFEVGKPTKINTIFIVKDGEIGKWFMEYHTYGRNEKYPYFNTDIDDKRFEIYVGYDDGSNLVHHELDKLLTERKGFKKYEEDTPL